LGFYFATQERQSKQNALYVGKIPFRRVAVAGSAKTGGKSDICLWLDISYFAYGLQILCGYGEPCPYEILLAVYHFRFPEDFPAVLHFALCIPNFEFRIIDKSPFLEYNKKR
jgi:hypothetical protein